MEKLFYRVCSTQTKQGLWYDQEGSFTGLIHDRMSFCTNNALRMDFDETLIGFLSATPTLDTLWNWFSKEDILRLQKLDFFIHEYKVTDFHFYERFQHDVINQASSTINRRLILSDDLVLS